MSLEARANRTVNTSVDGSTNHMVSKRAAAVFGSTGPLSINPDAFEYGKDDPFVRAVTSAINTGSLIFPKK